MTETNRPQVSSPSPNVTIELHPDGYLLVYRWRPMLLLTIALLLLDVWLVTNFGFQWPMLFAFWMTWYLVCTIVDSTEVKIDRERFIVRHGPLPFPFLDGRSRKIPIRKVATVYAEKIESKGVRYVLRLFLSDRSEIGLLMAFRDRKLADEVTRSLNDAILKFKE